MCTSVEASGREFRRSYNAHLFQMAKAKMRFRRFRKSDVVAPTCDVIINIVSLAHSIHHRYPTTTKRLTNNHKRYVIHRNPHGHSSNHRNTRPVSHHPYIENPYTPSPALCLQCVYHNLHLQHTYLPSFYRPSNPTFLSR
jgi:hypothetical protein